jgi:putative thioredoxin
MTMDQLFGAAPRQGGGGDLVKNSTTATFMADVIDASHDVAIVVDFWAPWCGPCKQLGPALEKAVKEANGAVRMVKINIDENPELAQQMRIQSIPAVYAFRDGRPVDGFVGALAESQLKQFVKRLAGSGAVASPVEQALEMAKEAMTEGDAATAANLYAQILQHDPANVEAMAGSARALVAMKDYPQAREVLERVPAAQQNHAEVTAARAALELAEAGEKAAGAIGDHRARLAKDADDHEARLELASALFAAGQREEAVDELLEIIRRNREWNEQAARKQLVKFFEAMGPTDPLTLSGRRRLSSLLFS